MVEWIAEGVRNGLSPFLKLLPVGCVLTCAESFVNSVRTHCTPLIVVAHKPYLCNRLETFVLCYHLRDEVTMVVDDRHLLCVFVIEFLSGFCLQQKILVHECFHNYSFYY